MKERQLRTAREFERDLERRLGKYVALVYSYPGGGMVLRIGPVNLPLSVDQPEDVLSEAEQAWICQEIGVPPEDLGLDPEPED